MRRSEAAVAELRRRKHRDEKPFAVMLRKLQDVQAICEVSPLERQLLESPRAPIVLLRKRAGCRIANSSRRAIRCLGVMLPYTPLHHLLLDEVQGIPLVMTSGNRSDEPIAYEEADAMERLRGIADLFLVHDRPIHLRCDDSVTRVVAGQELPVRRSRGYAPQPVPLPVECGRPTLAVGGQLKVAFALGRGRQAILSHHMGDLDHFAAYPAFSATSSFRAALRHPPATHRSRSASRLCLDALCAEAGGSRRAWNSSPCSTITPTWRVAWRSTG